MELDVNDVPLHGYVILRIYSFFLWVLVKDLAGLRPGGEGGTFSMEDSMFGV